MGRGIIVAGNLRLHELVKLIKLPDAFLVWDMSEEHQIFDLPLSFSSTWS